MKNTHHRDLPSGQGRGYIEENLGVLNREEVPLLVARPPVPRPLPALPEVVRGQEEYREVRSPAIVNSAAISSGAVSSPGLIVTLSDSDSQTSTPRGQRSRTGSPDYSPPEQQRNNLFFVTSSPSPKVVPQASGSSGSQAGPSVVISSDNQQFRGTLNPTVPSFTPGFTPFEIGTRRVVKLQQAAPAFIEPSQAPRKHPLTIPEQEFSSLNAAVAAWTPAVNHYPTLPPVFTSEIKVHTADQRSVGRPVAEVTSNKVQSFTCQCFHEASNCMCAEAIYRCELTVEVKLKAGTRQ